MNYTKISLDDLDICPIFFGEKKYQKVSFPIKVGMYSLFEYRDFKFYFDLNEEIKFIHVKKDIWPHPNDFVKRTKGNDFIYYSSGEYYGGIYDATGEYYVPCFLYPSNNLWGRDIYDIINIARSGWNGLTDKLIHIPFINYPKEIRRIIQGVIKKDEKYLIDRAIQLRKILSSCITVLPPDTRHVDYEVIPIVISDGCLYHCKFCRVKSRDSFRQRTKQEIVSQIRLLRDFYARDLKNYSSIYLGLHDALNCSMDIIKFSIEQAWKILEIEDSYLKDKSIFLFGSVDSLLMAKYGFFDYLNSIPHTQVFINIGLESVAGEVLKLIGKPIDPKKVEDSFFKMMDINKKYINIEVSANFLFDLNFPVIHWESILRLISDHIKRPFHKGTIYFSPLRTSNKREQLKKFMTLKRNIPLPTYLYIIQRL